jgi:6-pyruvoyltetrahydropterin/6-carboxytetrahydropterin synthase
MSTYRVVKTYGHEQGLSCAFRQWHAENTHCKFLHGYAIAVELVFEGPLDHRNWVISFGELKPIKAFLEKTFDHKTIIAVDDPELAEFQHLSDIGVLQLVILPDVGMEKFAEHISEYVELWLNNSDCYKARLVSVKVSEHPSNSVYFYPKGK